MPETKSESVTCPSPFSSISIGYDLPFNLNLKTPVALGLTVTLTVAIWPRVMFPAAIVKSGSRLPITLNVVVFDEVSLSKSLKITSIVFLPLIKSLAEIV